MTELRQFLAMLQRTGTPYRTRDRYPTGIAVMVEHPDAPGVLVTEWWFDDTDLVQTVFAYKADEN